MMLFSLAYPWKKAVACRQMGLFIQACSVKSWCLYLSIYRSIDLSCLDCCPDVANVENGGGGGLLQVPRGAVNLFMAQSLLMR